MQSYLALTRQILYWLVIGPVTGRPLRVGEVFRQMMRIGVRALPMVCLTSLTVGFALALLIAQEVAKLGAYVYVPHLITAAIFHQMGPLLISVIVIGRSGSAVAAELGTMKVSEEIEALEVMAINPIRYLIVPRFIAFMVMLPALTIFGMYVGVGGAWIVCRFALDWNTSTFIMRCLESTMVVDLYAGVVKSIVFAWLIITVACHAGLHTEGGAEGVGQATTNSVVYSILSMLVANAALTFVFYYLR